MHGQLSIKGSGYYRLKPIQSASIVWPRSPRLDPVSPDRLAAATPVARLSSCPPFQLPALGNSLGSPETIALGQEGQ
ncbi:hypothetical protein [Alkalinema sp. FACHB-956]|uniref:hypothetical protein n=1 Tax=Alkalinema sp. FACHB-956 TaxID=2692768 RepID=UPI0016899913|nr:hypothetical protein [Alkalinema sp. FACHB-956]MBD2329716.1 hypothetical protein [Alkalinema sp. FACHB-956]